MNGGTLGLILALALVVYGLRYAGFALALVARSPRVLDYSRFVPLTVFAALLTRAIPSPPGEWLPRALAIGCAGIAVHRTKQAWFGLIAGFVAYALLRRW